MITSGSLNSRKFDGTGLYRGACCCGFGDEDGFEFGDYVAIAFERNAEGDLREYRQLMTTLAAAYGDLSALLRYESEKTWGRQLEAKWPVIREVAELLIAGAHVSTEVVWALL